MNRHRHRLATLALACVAVGCVYPAERGKMLEERCARLEADKAQLEASLLAQREQLEAQLPRIQEALDKLETASRRANADTGVQVEELQVTLATLRGQYEEQSYKLARVESELETLRRAPVPSPESPAVEAPQPATAAPEVAASPVKTVPAKTSPSAEASVAAPAKAVAPAPKPAEKAIDKKDRQAFADAVLAKLSSSPKEGRALANEWLSKWPRHASAAQIHYELGMSHYREKKCRAALSSFGDIVKPGAPEAFVKSAWAPKALLKSADCFQTLSYLDQARTMLEEILASYPKSPEAKEAKVQLEKLDASKSAKPAKGKKR